MFGPRVTGSLCTLRPPREDEAEAMSAWIEDAEVTRTLLLRFPPGMAREREWLDQASRDADTIHWAIEVEGVLVGVSSIVHIDWPQRHAQTGTLIGNREYWGRGVGGESMRLRTGFAFTQTTLHKLNSSYLENNPASGRAQAGAGYREVGRRREQYFRDGRWVDEILTEVMREDWLALHAGEGGQPLR